MEKHIIKADDGVRCHHPRFRPPHGSYFGDPGELRRCPECLKWWRRAEGYGSIWDRVRFFHFDDRRRIKEFEARERNQMHTLIGSDKIVED